MTLSKAAQEEIRGLARSEALKVDLAAVAASRHNPFVKAGVVDVDAGQTESRTRDLVLAILESSQLYYICTICTINRGGVRGEPVLVGSNEIDGIEDFE